MLFSQTKRFSFTESFMLYPQKPLVFATKTAHSNNFSLSSKIAFFTYKKPFICTNFSLFPPKATLFYPPLPISTTLNLLFAKNTAVLLLFALILCCKAGTSHRFKAFSPPFCAKSRFRLVPLEHSAKIFFDRALNRGRRTESTP